MNQQPASNDYQYDVFLSYSREPIIYEWVHEHFLDLFRFHLQGGLGYSPTIFVDTLSIYDGDAWPLRLKMALAYSKCLVVLSSPSYFESEWCMKECHVMLHREKEAGFGIEGNGRGLVLPVIISDGESRPQYMKNIQSTYFDQFVKRGSGFTKTELYIDFQVKMSEWTKEVARAIKNAPDWNSDWINERIINIPKLEIPDFDTPPRLR
ncbi:MAG: TIR domain [Phormidesmis priestleyi Ana]|uniref:TIR domain n=1 Tax=Phormidesmis priestleyi Ana TaxID=1666911 RepID=A0A0P8DI49_9CYAN|nr:MAG: TIR domain [Phormidesmis priestleyi Ana]